MTHQLFIGRFYLFAGSCGFKAQHATTGNPPRSGIILNGHTGLEEGV